ncbi:xanthine dehydrogenase family protein molybdopterin-binding subunit [Salipiger sp.]|uniref:xanthine dehydrogenase family protein molybdopterin-binding subunit n=1 Tax=Salipiger sp. TaxID=2078585 RepID=UPI003A976E45
MSDSTALPAAETARMGSNSGQPMTRRDGVLKVTGTAPYAADNTPAGLAHAVFAPATIARGRVTHLDVAAAMTHPGVIHVMTPANRPPLALDPTEKPNRFSFLTEVLQDDTVRYAGQPIALVVAETLEAATEGAALLAPQYAAETPRIGLDAGRYATETVGMGSPAGVGRGDVEAGFAAAARVVEHTSETPSQYHNAMEPHAIVAEWQGDKVILHTPTQAPHMTAEAFAAWFGIPVSDVLIRTPFVGGGFGSKAIGTGSYILTTLAARTLGRPVKLSHRRSQMFGPVGHRGATRQTIRLGMDEHGALTALTHHSVSATSSFDEFLEGAAGASLMTYAAGAIRTSHEGARNDIGTPGPMRAPGEASGSAALEIAVDVAAEACGMDPLDFRLANYAETDPLGGKPYTSKALRECYAEGARAFGWSERPLAPGRMRDEDGLLVGWGMGTAIFPCPMFAAEARATLRADGTGLVETSLIDMGQGAWTALAQIAADALGLDVSQVELRGGASDLPDAGVAGGSGHTATAGMAIEGAGTDAVNKLAELAAADPDSPLFGTGNTGVVARGGRLYSAADESRSESYVDILARARRDGVEGSGKGGRDPSVGESHAMQAHGAVFAEVKVDPDLCQMRVTRLVGAFAAGRIINPRMVQSQYRGGMIWGQSFALLEGAVTDPRTGRIMNADLGEYHVPVNADVPSVEALLIPEEDTLINPLGIKGVGEIGITGTAGAIANAVWHATGYRATQYPIRIEDVLAAMG